VAANTPQATGGLESDVDNGNAAPTQTPEELAKIAADKVKTDKFAEDTLAAKKKKPQLSFLI
jgi:hypothetical protein